MIEKKSPSPSLIKKSRACRRRKNAVLEHQTVVRSDDDGVELDSEANAMVGLGAGVDLCEISRRSKA